MQDAHGPSILLFPRYRAIKKQNKPVALHRPGAKTHNAKSQPKSNPTLFQKQKRANQSSDGVSSPLRSKPNSHAPYIQTWIVFVLQ